MKTILTITTISGMTWAHLTSYTVSTRCSFLIDKCGCNANPTIHLPLVPTSQMYAHMHGDLSPCSVYSFTV